MSAVAARDRLSFGDAGSSWCKVYLPGDQRVKLLPTRELARGDARFDWGTGHTARPRSENFENDLISLSRGALELVEEDDFTVLDLGSRDAKLVGFEGRRPVRLDWSVGCAAATGATVEMLGKFYEIEFDRVPIVDEWMPITCGTYAVERVLDGVSAGEPVERAVGRFLHGLARSSFDFAGRPERLYLSGGFTQNRPYVELLGRYCEVVALGRTVPLAGLWAFAEERNPGIGPLPEALERGLPLEAEREERC
jgi:hypothetical protein